MKLVACLVVSSFVTFAASAHAQEGPPAGAPETPAHGGGEKGGGSTHHEFGQAGVIAVEAATGLNVSNTSHKAPAGEDPEATLNLRIEPSAHYFVAENLSIGALLAFDLTKQGDEKEQEISVGPLVGYNLPLGDKLSLWPQVGGAYVLVSEEVAGQEGSGHKIQALANVPLLIHLAPHFHFGLGPYLVLDVQSKMEGEDSVKDTTLGLAGTIGGWL